MIEHIALNADMSRRVVVDTASMDWQPSPSPTVWRKRLHLDGPAETGRVTSIVRYDAGSRFPEHAHPDGEEIFVLDGVFSDEHGDYPAGAYLLNPDGTTHAPFSRLGCTLFVKLRQYAGADRPQLRVDTTAGEWLGRRGARRDRDPGRCGRLGDQCVVERHHQARPVGRVRVHREVDRP